MDDLPDAKSLAYCTVLTTMRIMLDRFFDNSPELLVLDILNDEDISMDNLEQIRKMLDEQESDESDGETKT